MVGDKTFDKQTDAMDALAASLSAYYDKVTTVSYAVGDQCVSCPITAGEMAKKDNKKVQFRLASKTFDSKDDADKIAKLSREAGDKITMKTVKDGKEVACVGGASAGCCHDGAGETAKAGDGKTCPVGGDAKSCPAGGAQTASAGQCPMSGGKAEAVEYVIGDQKFHCPFEAKVEYQKARIMAAVKAIQGFESHG